MQTYAKAIVGALIAALGTVSAGLSDGSLTPVEIVAAITAFLVAFSAVWATPNKTSRP